MKRQRSISGCSWNVSCNPRFLPGTLAAVNGIVEYRTSDGSALCDRSAENMPRKPVDGLGNPTLPGGGKATKELFPPTHRQVQVRAEPANESRDWSLVASPGETGAPGGTPRPAGTYN